MSAGNKVFFSRCRPENSDPIDLVVRARRIFIGYPAQRPGAVYERGHLRDALVDFWCSDADWKTLYVDFKSNPHRKQYQQNRNFVRSIKPGAIALVPRPNRGVVYVGRVVQPFEILNDPPWGEEYLSFRQSERLGTPNEFGHLANVAQCCEVDRFREIPFSLIPAWIRKSLFSRSTYGHIHKLQELDLDPYAELDHLIDDVQSIELPWTDDVVEVEKRLIRTIGPNTFEHLCVALLQLEYPEQIWAYIGGSGDGEVDGIGSTPDGKTIGLLQCKWKYTGEKLAIAHPIYRHSARQILAALIHSAQVSHPEGVEFWSRKNVAFLVLKHARNLPIATSMRIRNPMGALRGQ